MISAPESMCLRSFMMVRGAIAVASCSELEDIRETLWSVSFVSEATKLLLACSNQKALGGPFTTGYWIGQSCKLTERTLIVDCEAEDDAQPLRMPSFSSRTLIFKKAS